MKGRIPVLVGAACCTGMISVILSSTAHSQLDPGRGSVALQAVTPGYSQSGNANVSGTMRAGQFSGSNATLQSPDASPAVDGATSTASGIAVRGRAIGVSGTTIGIKGEATNSTNGIGVEGTGGFLGVRGTGVFGGDFRSTAPAGVGVNVNSSVDGIQVLAGRNGIVMNAGQSTPGYGLLINVQQSSVGIQNNGSTVLNGLLGVNALASLNSGANIGQSAIPGWLNVFAPGAYAETLANFQSPAKGPHISHIHYGSNGEWYIRSANNNGVVYLQDIPGGRMVFGTGGPINGYAATLWGNVRIVGQMDANGKSFVIDHPLDPENKVLRHSCVESDVRMNMYRGVVVTDGKGFAVIEMPDWFEALNEDIQVQLTVSDNSEDFVLAKIVDEYSNGQFRIRTSKPNVKVHWLANGVRKDAFAKANPLQVEEEKAPLERGRYLNPEAFEQGKGVRR